MHLSPSDDDLVARIGDGDADAYRALVDRHASRVLAVAAGIVGSRALAEDVTQEVFLTVWRKAAGWRSGRARFGTWLHRVAVNRAIDMRDRRAASRVPLDDAAEVADEAPSPTEHAEARQRRVRVGDAVCRLPDAQRTAILLTYSGGLTNAEVAAAMDLSVKAVESLLVRARRSLREALAKAGLAPGEGL
ncbi:RNA polymerase sigma-70 factor (ECF subfamily) [Constrictibacter sp. MBR-5]|jgi:RNA polymerase sigma-70 factor (ECF subfamily)|uniref:RNA polymerase sigma factor n=1 Tax=Constrictibacter sp. MBR-5 TaxID=3156467 RepID=UPI003390A21D